MKAERQRSTTVGPTARHWATKLADALTPAQHAAVEWDRARAAVKDLPEQDQAKAWRDLLDALQVARQKIEAR
jgi:hypothetical protein